VEKFELIATTGKNAKMPIIRFFQSTKLHGFCLIKNIRAKARLNRCLLTTALRPWLREKVKY
jgi:hypothetical protein